MDCTNDLVGVTANTLIPFYDELTTDEQDAIIVSKSGLFVDTLPGGIDLMTIDDVDSMRMALTEGLNATKEASKILNDELLIAINSRYQAAKAKFYGDIGRRSISANLSTSARYQGQRYRMHEPIAGAIRINRISVCVSGTANFQVYIGACDAGERNFGTALYGFPVASVAGTWTDADLTSVPDGIALPMQVEGIAQEYYIFWDSTEAGVGVKPKNNEIKCGTCGNATAVRALDNYMMYNGVSFNDLNNLRSGVTLDKYGRGLSINCTVGCEHEMIICREYNKKEAVSLMMNRAAWYKAGELWIEYGIKSGFVNRNNMTNREYLWGKRNSFRAEFDKRITAIADTMTIGETNCYVCKEDTIIKGHIFS